MHRRSNEVLCFLAALLMWSPAIIAENLPQQTALDQYLNKPDDSYSWKVVSEKKVDGVTQVIVDMISQTWRTPEEVNRPQWQHWVKLSIPENVQSEYAFMMIGGGANRPGEKPDGPDEAMIEIAKVTNSVVAELSMIPNQPLIFHGDGQERTEDDLIGYTWDQFIKTGDPTWPARNPMVKSAIRAMDTITAVMASETGGNKTVDKFVVAGGSKRGWTTWLTGLDPRVKAIVPIVIDVVNANPSMRHHFEAYGFWAPSIGNYVQHGIMERLNHPRLVELYRLVDPYYYRHRLQKPKFIVNGSGDQFFLPDSSQFYFDDLLGEKHLRYVPNADHGLRDSDSIESITAFYSLIISGQQRPEFSWTFEKDGSIRVTTSTPPAEVLLWQATNPNARDFRIETLGAKYTSTKLKDQGNGVYAGNVDKPKEGFRAYYVELKYDVGPLALKMSTAVRVIPDVLPYKGKDPSLPPYITIRCDARDQQDAKEIAAAGKAMADQKLKLKGFRTEVAGKRIYFNWKMVKDDKKSDGRRAAKTLAEWLETQPVDGLAMQLESGPGITGLK